MKDMESEMNRYEKELTELKSQNFVYEKLSQQNQNRVATVVVIFVKRGVRDE